MAEKNTLSILESIKKKMQKLDQKSKKSEIVSDADGEFEYIAPATKNAEDAWKASIDSANLQTETPVVTSGAEDNSMFNDDFEDEVKNPAPKQQEVVEANAKIEKDAAFSDAAVSKEIIDQSLENSPSVAGGDLGVEDQMFQPEELSKMPSQNLPLQSDQPALSKMPPLQQDSPKAPAQHPKSEDKDLAKKKEEAAKNLAPIDLPPSNDLDFNDLDIDEDQNDLPLTSTSADKPEQAVQDVYEQPTQEVENTTQKSDDSDSSDDFDFDLNEEDAINEQVTTATEQGKNPPQSAATNSEIDDLNLDDLDLEEEKDVKSVATPAAPVKAKTPTIDDLDDIDLDELLKDENLGTQQQKKPAATAKEEVSPLAKAQEKVAASTPQQQEQERDDFEDVDIDEELEEESNIDQAQEVEQKVTSAAPQNIDEDFDDVDLDGELDKIDLKSPYNQNKQMKQNYKPVIYGRKDDFDDEVQSTSSIANASSKRGSLLTEEAMQETTQSIKKLIDAKNVINGIRSFSQSSTLNELAVQIMEPKLDKWLNDNLPQLVEKIVQEEIKKIFMKEKE